MGKLPERKSDFRSRSRRSEVKLQSKLHVARVAGASKASEVAGANRQGCVDQVAELIVRAVENIEEVRLEHQAHVFSGQFEVFPQRQVRHETVGASKAPHAVCSRAYGRGISKGKRIKELAWRGRSERYAGDSIRAPSAHIRAIHQYSIHDPTAKRGSCQDGDGRSGLHTCYAAQLPPSS